MFPSAPAGRLARSNLVWSRTSKPPLLRCKSHAPSSKSRLAGRRSGSAAAAAAADCAALHAATELLGSVAFQ